MEQSIKVFVPLGTQKFPFNRLVRAMNGLVEKGLYRPDEIVMQSAVYEERPLFTHCRMIPFERFNRLMAEAEVVVTHSGVNSIISCMKQGKPLVIVPRLKAYGEHVDDHQKEIAEVMRLKYGVTVAYDLENIGTYMEVARSHTYKPWVSHNDELIGFLKHLLTGGG